jgi:hypothetical protein
MVGSDNHALVARHIIPTLATPHGRFRNATDFRPDLGLICRVNASQQVLLLDQAATQQLGDDKTGQNSRDLHDLTRTR